MAGIPVYYLPAVMARRMRKLKEGSIGQRACEALIEATDEGEGLTKAELAEILGEPEKDVVKALSRLNRWVFRIAPNECCIRYLGRALAHYPDLILDLDWTRWLVFCQRRYFGLGDARMFSLDVLEEAAFVTKNEYRKKVGLPPCRQEDRGRWWLTQ